MGSTNQALAAGLKHHRAGQLDSAIDFYDQTLARQPQHPDALHLKGLALHQRGDHAAAVALICTALSLRPSEAGFHNNLGEAYRAMGRFDDAQTAYGRALQIRSDFAEAHNNLGNVLFELRRWSEAAASYHRALKTKQTAAWYTNLGNAQQRLKHRDEAIQNFRRALQLDPGFVEAHNMLAMALRDQGKLDEAERSLRRALELDGKYVMALNNLGIVLKEHGRMAEAEAVLSQSLTIRPDFLEARDTLGLTQMAQGKHDQAVASFNAVLAKNPKNTQAHRNRALTWLAAGDYPRGWPEYEWRFAHDPTLARSFDKPRWEGAPVDGQTLLVHAEQGLGDAIMFIRFAPRVARCGARVIVECPSTLTRLLRCVDGIDQLVEAGSALPAYDVHAPLLSLPLLLQCDLEDVGDPVPYIAPEPLVQQIVERELPRAKFFRVGINWQGNPDFATDRFRSVPLSSFKPLAGVEGVQLISLQHGPGHEQLAMLSGSPPVFDLGRALDRLAQAANVAGASYRMALAAAAVSVLDLIITSDTMMAHLAGAMGKPVWLITSSSPDWRWQHGRSDNAWYPTMRLFRQVEPGNWASAISQAADVLAEMLPSRREAA